MLTDNFRSLFSTTLMAQAMLCLLLTGCALTPPEPPAALVVPAAFKEAGPWQPAAARTPVPDAWWTLFQDPVLNDLQDRLVVGNQNLKSVVAQVANARAVLDASQSAGRPTLSAGSSATRTRNPENANGVGVNSRGPGNNLSLSGSANWEIDLWGRLTQATIGAQAQLQASVDDLAAARLSAHATLAQTYFSMRSAEAQYTLLERSVQAYQRSQDLTQLRYDAGVVARSDVLQAQTQLKSAQAQMLESGTQRAQLEHAIAVLLGLPPSELTLARNSTLPPSPAIPELLPSTLLERRPDIAATQRRVAAAYAQIGVTDAAFYPSLNLSSTAGFRSSSLANLISTPNFFWSLGSSLAQVIFDGGQRKLASAQARNNADQATAVYRQTVLTALQEVEDNLVLTDQLQRQAQLQDEALQAARRNQEIALDQYRAGTVSYLNVVIAQTAVLNSESSLLSLRNRQLAAVNQLLKNIAGRWEGA